MGAGKKHRQLSKYKQNMIVESPQYCLYRHIRKDINLPFYVGVGIINNKTNSIKKRYKRAYVNNGRNDIWNKITKKTDYTVEIMLESDNKENIEMKEVEFIKLYGRIDLGTGSLCNFTDGGHYHLNYSKTSSIKRKETYIRNGTYDAWIKRAAENRQNSKQASLDTNSKKTYVYNINGFLINSYPSFTEAIRKTNQNYVSVKYAMHGNRNHKGYIFSFTNYGYKLDLSLFNITYRNNDKCRPICKISVKSGDIIEDYPSITKAAELNKIESKKLNYYLIKQKEYAGFFWAYLDKTH